MLLEARLRDGIYDGSITIVFRRWQRSQVVAGGRYRTGRDMIEVGQVDIVAPAAITAGEAQGARPHHQPADGVPYLAARSGASQLCLVTSHSLSRIRQAGARCAGVS